MSTSGRGMNASLELASMEMEAKERAKKHVANLLQRADQLEKVEQIRKRIARRKGSVEAMLKTAVQSQLDGVKTGLNQLHHALNDIQEISQNLKEIDASCSAIQALGERLKPLRDENSQHSQLAAAVDNLIHIFNVPETISKCEELISEGKLLNAHKQIIMQQYSQNHKQLNDVMVEQLVMKYFSDMDRPIEMLAKQLWLILQRTIISVRMEPTIIVTVLRIIEREERTDALMAKQYEQMKLPDRPRKWKQRAFEVMNEAVHTRIEGNQFEDRSENKMWLVRHLEVTRQLVLEDLRVVKLLCEPCFPPHYNIVQQYINMYHNNISLHLADIQYGLEGNEIVSLLTWINDYSGPELMGHVDLQIDTKQLPPLLDKKQLSALHDKYITTLRSNFHEWMANSLKTDSKDWLKDIPPDADDKGYYNTTLPVILCQMFEQNLQVAATIGTNLVSRVVNLIAEQLNGFTQIYRHELAVYKEQHLLDRNQPPCFIHYMIANANNCQTFADFAVRLKTKYGGDLNVEAHLFDQVAEQFSGVSKDTSIIKCLCTWLLDEIFLDLHNHIEELLTKKWIGNSVATDTICITIEDYCQDFVHLRDHFYDTLLQRAEMRVAREYFRALFTPKRIGFKNYEERNIAAEQIKREGDHFRQYFKRLIRKSSDVSLFEPLPALAEVIKLRDTSLLSLEITGFVTNYPDIRIDQLVTILLMREDMNRSSARQLVVDCLGEDHDLKPKTKTFFSQLHLVPS